MSTILITGAAGFIGSALCSRLASSNKVIGVDITGPTDGALNIAWERADLTDSDSVAAICEKYSPDVVIHCAGIAHQKIGTVDSATYMRVNSEATENLAKAAAKSNPDVRFIFLSSVSVYGEVSGVTSRKGAKAQKRKNNNGVYEDGECQPSSDYAASKLDAERRLIALSDRGTLHNLVILRLAPVYDRDWSFNLDRRVIAPMNIAYIRFGSGSQKMSALARPNLVDFIEFLLKRRPRIQGIKILNVCDSQSYEFNTIIQILRKSGIRPNRPVISVPLSPVWIATRIAGALFPNKRNWLHSCYDKVALSLVFNNDKMLGTGFRPVHSLETIFYWKISHLTQRRKGAMIK
jgi:nucleoside-diphosphate-sugar epimerase